MEWLAVTIVGFLGATAVVIALGRKSTARWERESRARRRRGPVVVRRRVSRLRRPGGDRDRDPAAR